MLYILGDNFNQDPLEEHFGRQRMKGVGIDNPIVENYGHNERKIILAKSQMLTVMQCKVIPENDIAVKQK